MANTIVIFGASGDLTSRKLIPSLYRSALKGRLPELTRIVGVSRTQFSDEEFRNRLAESTAKYLGQDFDASRWNDFAQHIHYRPGDITRDEDFAELAKYLDEIERGESCVRVYYLSTAPSFYEPAIAGLGKCGLAAEEKCQRRIVIEKPFGSDLQSARALNEAVHRVFEEHQVYRIDHYLGKETVQNLLVLRFANAVFEPIWNRQYIDHVQITAAEEVTVGRRGDYYDRAGVLRDMFQNHLLQLLMIAAMEAPLRFEADAVRNEKVKVLQAIRRMEPDDVARETFRGQYDGYRDEPGVVEGSQTATFAAMQLWLDNWRWKGVPFYLRSGKAMSCRTTQIVVQFHEPPHIMFKNPPDANRLVIQLQPDEGIQLHFTTKVPDAGMRLQMADLDFRFHSKFDQSMPEAYERLLLDTLQGDASLFARSDEVELSWAIIDPILTAWEENGQPQLYSYEPGFWGPPECTEWMHRQDRFWFDRCPVLR